MANQISSSLLTNDTQMLLHLICDSWSWYPFRVVLRHPGDPSKKFPSPRNRLTPRPGHSALGDRAGAPRPHDGGHPPLRQDQREERAGRNPGRAGRRGGDDFSYFHFCFSFYPKCSIWLRSFPPVGFKGNRFHYWEKCMFICFQGTSANGGYVLTRVPGL